MLHCKAHFQCRLFGTPRGLGLATAATSAAFLPHLEHPQPAARVTIEVDATIVRSVRGDRAGGEVSPTEGSHEPFSRGLYVRLVETYVVEL